MERARTIGPLTLNCILLAVAAGAQQTRPSVDTVAEAWSSQGADYAETDSVAVCRVDNDELRLFATAKDGDRIDVFDAETGRFLQHVGSTGTEPGRFKYPNGIVAVRFPAQDGGPGRASAREAFLVVERDNARVQAFWADDLQPAGTFGHDVLHRPYGAAVSYRRGDIDLFVTDTEVPLDRTVHCFRLSMEGRVVQAHHVRAFGERSGKGAVLEAESVVVDDRLGRVLLCDEHETRSNVKVYTLDGGFTGTTFGEGFIQREPEGIVVHDDPDRGLVIVTDQRPDVSIWHVFDRKDYRHLAAFTGRPAVANTDGICLYPHPFGRFRAGAFYAVHDDADIRAYAVADILSSVRASGALP